MRHLELTIEHKYLLDGQPIPGVTEVLDSNGLISPFAKSNPQRTEEGTLVHTCMALYGAGNLDWTSVDPQILGYVLSGVRFYEKLEFKPAFLERRDYHRDYLYAGTIDGIGSSRLGDLLPDWKTGKAACHAQPAHRRAPSGKDFVRVSLVTHIPHQAVIRRVVDVMQCNGQLDRAEIGG